MFQVKSIFAIKVNFDSLNRISVLSTIRSDSLKCFLCGKAHYLNECEVFMKKKTPLERFEFCKEKKFCIGCFISKHTVANCRGRKCSDCHRNHHSLLHRQEKKAEMLREENSAEREKSSCSMLSSCAEKLVLLPTAVAMVCIHGKFVPVRVMLDSGSQVSFIVDSLVK